MTHDIERWSALIGYEGMYEVSTLGNVRSLSRLDSRGRRVAGRMLKQPLVSGYPSVAVCRDGKYQMRYVHQMVLECFAGPRPAGFEGCHYDGDRRNNRLDNLRWDTPQANGADRSRHGTASNSQKTACAFGHPLLHPNLSPAKARKGHRECLSCARGRAHARHYRLTFTKEIGDRYYAALQASVSA